MYANSRMLYGLAQQGNAPKVFMQVNKQGTPIPAVLFSAALIFGCVLLNYFVPEDALSHLIYIVVGALVLNWAMRQYSGLRFHYYDSLHHVDSGFSGIYFNDSGLDCGHVRSV